MVALVETGCGDGLRWQWVPGEMRRGKDDAGDGRDVSDSWDRDNACLPRASSVYSLYHLRRD